MDKHQRIKEEVEQSMSSIENLARAKAPDFFYTKLEARMENELLNKSTSFIWLVNLRVSIAVLSLFMVLNVGTLLLFTQNEATTEVNEANIDTFKQEYFSTSDDYQYRNYY